MSDLTASILDVASAAGVSKSTASRALAGAPDVSKATRARVQQVADELGFVKDFHAQALKSGRSRTVAIYVRSVQLGYYGSLIASVQTRLEERGYRLAVTSSSPRDTRPLDMLLSLRPAAAIVASGRVNLEAFEAYRRVPIVLAAGAAATEGNLSSVYDDGFGCEELAAEVVRRGHSRVAVVDVPTARSRTLGPRSRSMRDALERRGVTVTMIATAEPDDAPVEADLRRAASEVTAIMCPNDPTLIEVWNRLTEWGLSVPRDLSLTGYDGASPFAGPAIGLTTWEQPIAEIGRHVVAELLRRLEDKDAEPSHIPLRGQLITGRTLAEPAPR